MSTFTSLFVIIGDAALKATLLLALAWVTARALKNRSAAARHLLRTFALYAALLLPVLSIVLPRWSMPGIPLLVPTTQLQAPPQTVRPAAAALPEIQAEAPVRIVARAKVSRPTAKSAILAPAEQPRSISTFTPATTVSSPSPKFVLNWPLVLAMIWLFGAVLLVTRMLVARLRLQRLVRRARLVVDLRWISELESAVRLMGVRRPVGLLHSADTDVPLATGTLHPKIILPAEYSEWASLRRSAVLHHELAHIKRLDTFTQALTDFALALYWFHPMVWLTAISIRAERERACDDYVLALGTKPSEYAHELLEIASTLRQPALSAALAMARRSQLEGRLLALLNPALRRGSVPRKAALLIAALTLCIVFPLAAIHAGQQSKPSPATRDQAPGSTATQGSGQQAPTAQPSAKPGASDEDMMEPPQPPEPPEPAEAEAPEASREQFDELLARLADLRARLAAQTQEQTAEQKQKAAELYARAAELQARTQALQSQADSSDLSHAEAARQAQMAELQARLAALQASMADQEWLAGPVVPPILGIQGGVSGGQVGGVTGGIPAIPAVPAVPAIPAIPSVPAVPPVPGGELDVCGTHVKLHNMSINSDNGHQRWNGYWSGDDCSVELRAEGKIEFNAEATEIQSISSAGFFEVNQRQGDTSKQIRVTPSSNGLQYVYKVNGKEQPFDAQAKAWFSNFLLELERSTGFDADSRVRKLLEKGGPSAVLDEINHLHGDYVRGLYFRKLLEQPNLPPAIVVRVINQAGEQITSDYEKARVLMEVARKYALADETTRAAFLNASAKLNGDYEHSRVLLELLKQPNISAKDVELALHSAAGIGSDYEKSRILLSLAAQNNFEQTYLDAYLKMVASMQSDYEKSRDLLAPMQRYPLDAKEINRILEAAATMSSDYEKSRVLTGLISKGKLDETEISQYVKVVDSIQSDYERSRSLSALLSQNTLSKDALAKVLDAAGRISSDYEKSQILLIVAQKYTLEGALRDKYISIANTLSNYERNRALAGIVHRASI